MQHLVPVKRSEWVGLSSSVSRRRKQLRKLVEAAGFVLLISVALPAAASFGILLGTGLAP